MKSVFLGVMRDGGWRLLQMPVIQVYCINTRVVFLVTYFVQVSPCPDEKSKRQRNKLGKNISLSAVKTSSFFIEKLLSHKLTKCICTVHTLFETKANNFLYSIRAILLWQTLQWRRVTAMQGEYFEHPIINDSIRDILLQQTLQ